MADPAATPFTEDPLTPAPAASVTPVADPPPVVPPTPAFVLPDSVKDMVGEGKKYVDVNAALNSINPAQDHISRIEAENASLRTQMDQTRTSEAILADIKAASQPQEPAPLAPTPQIDESVIANVVDQRLQATEANKLATNNTQSVVDKMTEHYGDAKKAEEAYIAKATDLGLGVGGLNGLAAQSPKAVLEMFGLSKPPPVPAKIGSSINTEALNNTPNAPTPVGSVMSGATSKDQVKAWQSFAPTE